MKEIEKKNENELQIELSTQGYVKLPFEPEDFRDFVIGLLGRPQSIEGIIDSPFEIENSDMKNVFELINQRIGQQNDSVLSLFRARIVYSNDTSVLINSLEELLSYNETKPLVSTSIHLTFQYLIQFQDKKVPEKQEINISFISSLEQKESEEIKKIYDDFLPNSYKRQVEKKNKSGFIHYSIKHTARTWGDDIESLLINHFKTLIVTESRSKNFIRRNDVIFGVILFLSIIGFGIYSGIKLDNKITIQRTNSIIAAFENKILSLEEVSNQIRFLAENSTSKSEGPLILGLVALFIGIFVFLIISTVISIPKRSYVLLTKESFKFKKFREKSYNWQFINFIITIITGIACSTLANYIFFYFNK